MVDTIFDLIATLVTSGPRWLRVGCMSILLVIIVTLLILLNWPGK